MIVVFPLLAVRLAVCAVVKAATVALNVAVVAPAATVTEDGTETVVSLLARRMLAPPAGAAALIVTVQESAPAAETVALTQASTVGTGILLALPPVPLPVRGTTRVGFVEALLVMVRDPVAAPAAVGANVRFRPCHCPMVRVSGKVVPAARANPLPVTVADRMVMVVPSIGPTSTIDPAD